VPENSHTRMDSEVFPYCFRDQGTLYAKWLVEVRSESTIDCPIPPCDCCPAEPRGSLSDVATYLGVNRIWMDGIDGRGVVVGIVDGGLLAANRIHAEVPRLVPQVVDGWPCENWGTIAGWSGHGNMLANAVLGIAPGASLHDIRIASYSSQGGLISDAIAGIHWAIEKYRATATPQILCCGWGIYQKAHDPNYATDRDHPLTRKIVEAMDEGILVLFAAGNGGQSCPARCCGTDTGPGKSIWGANGHPRVMTMGAVNIDEELIGYSSQGPAALDKYKPDFCGISHFKGYFPIDSGTSVACATAAGVVALLKQARPTLTQEAAKQILKTTAKDIGPPGWDRHSGAGIIQAKAAYEKVAGHRDATRIEIGRIGRLKTENQRLKELFLKMAIEGHSQECDEDTVKFR
jgi:serine protease AprX